MKPYRLAEAAESHRRRDRGRVGRGSAPVRTLADATGLTRKLSKALAFARLIHDRGRVLADLACAIADGPRRSATGGFPSEKLAMNKAWLAAALIAATRLAWLRLPAHDGNLATGAGRRRRMNHRVRHAERLRL